MGNTLHIHIDMAKEDWVSCKIPVLMAQAIDKVVELDVAKKNGVFSRSDFLTRVIAYWFSGFEKEFGMFVPREVRRNLKGYDTIKPMDFEGLKEYLKNLES